MAQKKNTKKVTTKSTTKKPITKKPVTKKTVAKKPVAKKVVAKSPAHLLPMVAFAVLALTSVVAICVLANKQKFVEDLQIEKVQDYLYEINYNDEFDWEYGQGFLTSRYANANAGKCSSVRNGNFVGRNYDWYYDEASDFINRIYDFFK